MAKKTYSENIKDFGKQYLDDTGRLVRTYAKGVETLFSGKTEFKQIPSHFVEYVKTDGDGYLRDVVKAGADFYLSVLKTNIHMGEKFIHGVLASSSKSKKTAAASKDTQE